MRSLRLLECVVLGAGLVVAGCSSNAAAPGADGGFDAPIGVPDTGHKDTGGGGHDAGKDATHSPEAGAKETGPETGAKDTGANETGANETGSGDVIVPADTGVDSGHDAGHDAGKAPILPGSSHGSAVAISPDDSVAVIVNRDVGSITVLSLAYTAGIPTPTLVKEVPVGKLPWQVVISPDSTSAYVVLRQDQKVVQITGLKTASPAVGSSAAVGSEATGLALTPTGALLYVTNMVDGTVSVIETSTMTAAPGSPIDLNAPLVATGLLVTGTETLTARAALAHPRSIAITNSGAGVDANETAYVTEYYAQATTPELNTGLNADTRKVGLVYPINVGTGVVGTPIQLAPLANMGFKDQAGNVAGCYPNQLQSIAVNGTNAYVLSVCASPQGPTGPLVTAVSCTPTTIATACATASATGGPLQDPICVQPSSTSAGPVCVDVASVKTTTAPLLSVIDTTTNKEVTAATASLNAEFLALYTSSAPAGLNPTADSNARRYPLFASDISFVPGTNVAYVSANGADAVFRVQYSGTTGLITEVGSSQQNFINLTTVAGTALGAASAGENPIGIAIGSVNTAFALVPSEINRIATVVDLGAQSVSGTATAPNVVSTTINTTTPGTQVLNGKRFFNTGMGRWSLKGQGWGACQSCHGDGLSDNVTWYFARGPRQSISLDTTFNKADPTNQRVLNWTSINDELADFEGNVRAVSGGVGAIVTADSVPPATTDRIDVTTACAAPPCLNGNGNTGLNGSAVLASTPSNPEGLTDPQSAADVEWPAVTAYVQQIRSPLRPTNLVPTDVAAGQTIFQNAGCAGCHGGAKWTISKVFYTPSIAEMAALKTDAWPALNGLPVTILPVATGSANKFMRYAGAAGSQGAGDQILCDLRNVGTFGVAEDGIAELGIDMKSKAQGGGDSNGDGVGYNVPSLFGLQMGAPYFHAGNAMTLESAFSSIFFAHNLALDANFLSGTPAANATTIRQLVAYLLSIDINNTDNTNAALFTIPTLSNKGGDFCH